MILIQYQHQYHVYVHVQWIMAYLKIRPDLLVNEDTTKEASIVETIPL